MECLFGQRLRCAREKELPLHAKHRCQRIDEFISGLSHSRLDPLDELFRLADCVPYISKRKALSAADQSQIGRIEFNCHLPVSAWGWEMSSSVYVTCITRSFYTQSKIYLSKDKLLSCDGISYFLFLNVNIYDLVVFLRKLSMQPFGDALLTCDV